MANCTNCGAPNPDGSRNCIYCGSALPYAPDPPKIIEHHHHYTIMPEDSSSAAYTAPQRRESGGRESFLPGLGCFGNSCLGCGAFLAILFCFPLVVTWIAALQEHKIARIFWWSLAAVSWPVWIIWKSVQHDAQLLEKTQTAQARATIRAAAATRTAEFGETVRSWTATPSATLTLTETATQTVTPTLTMTPTVPPVDIELIIDRFNLVSDCTARLLIVDPPVIDDSDCPARIRVFKTEDSNFVEIERLTASFNDALPVIRSFIEVLSDLDPSEDELNRFEGAFLSNNRRQSDRIAREIFGLQIQHFACFRQAGAVCWDMTRITK